MQRKWYNPKKSEIKSQNLVLHYDYKPVVYGTEKKINFLLDKLLKEGKRNQYTIKQSNGLYMLCKKTKYYRKRE